MVVMTAKLTITRAVLKCHVGRASEMAPNTCRLNMWLLLSHCSRVQLCATPETAAHQAPPSLGFSRQEHWSGLPFPSPMQESESEVVQSCPTPSYPMDCSPPGSLVHGIFQARVLERGAIAFSETCGTIRFGLRITPQLFYLSHHYQRCTRSHMWSSHTFDTAGPRPL